MTEISLLRVGRLLIACLPGEPTTMAGRRIKQVGWAHRGKCKGAIILHCAPGHGFTLLSSPMMPYMGMPCLYAHMSRYCLGIDMRRNTDCYTSENASIVW